MKLSLLSLLGIMLFINAAAQTTNWKVIHNGSLKMQANKEEGRNAITLSKNDLEKTGFLWINYSDKTTARSWKRSIVLVDENDKEVFKRAGSLCKVGNSFLRDINKKANTLKIYTWAVPADPLEAAKVRVRRIHLCTINFKD
jgi:hypothetical protein